MYFKNQNLFLYNHAHLALPHHLSLSLYRPSLSLLYVFHLRCSQKHTFKNHEEYVGLFCLCSQHLPTSLFFHFFFLNIPKFQTRVLSFFSQIPILPLPLRRDRLTPYGLHSSINLTVHVTKNQCFKRLYRKIDVIERLK